MQVARVISGFIKEYGQVEVVSWGFFGFLFLSLQVSCQCDIGQGLAPVTMNHGKQTLLIVLKEVFSASILLRFFLLAKCWKKWHPLLSA